MRHWLVFPGPEISQAAEIVTNEQDAQAATGAGYRVEGPFVPDMASLDRERLPVDTLPEAIPHLRRPFTPEAIRFKVQSVFKKREGTPFGCLIVAYIDARLAIERLNHVIPSWQATYRPVDGKPNLMWCFLTIDEVTRADVGESPKEMSKDLVSDSLKRAAVHFGVGVSCYALPQIRLTMDQSLGRIELRGRGDKQTIILTEHGHSKLREGYAKWLEEHGRARFGPPLDHGDIVGATLEEEPEAETGIGVGDGDGSAPGWQGVSSEQEKALEAMIDRAAEKGHAGLSDRATIQMRVAGQTPAFVDGQLAAWAKELDEFEPVPEAEVVPEVPE